MIDQAVLNQWASTWAEFMWQRTLDSTLVLIVIGIVWIAIRKRASAQVGYFLFLLVLVKLIFPVTFLHLDFLSGHIPRGILQPHVQHEHVLESDSLVVETPLHQEKPVTPAPESIERIAMSESMVSHHSSNTSWPLSSHSTLMLLWVAVVLSCLGKMVYGERRTRLLVQNSQQMNPTDIPLDFSELSRLTRIKWTIPILTAPWVSVPAVYGVFRPILLMPKDCLKLFTPDQLRWILLHELAHISRWDTGVVLFQKLIQFLFFFHPGVWLANQMVDRQRELLCDDIALMGCTSNRRECGEGFLKVVEMATPLPVLRHTSLGLLDSKTSIKNRLLRILDSSRPLRPRLSHAGSVYLVAFSLIILPVSIAQIHYGDSIFPLRGPNGEFYSLGHGRMHAVAFSPDGKYFATGGLTGIYLWDYETGEMIRCFFSSEDQAELLLSLSFSSDGTKILAIEDWFVSGPASVWDVASGERLCTIDPVVGAAFSPDGTQVAAASWSGYLRLCDSQTGEVIRDLQLKDFHAGTQGITYSLDGDKVLIAGREGTVIWDPSTGGLLRVDKRVLPDDYYEGTQSSGVECVAVSHDGTQYVTCEYAGAFKWETTIILRDLQTGEIVRTYGPYKGTPKQASFSPDDSKVLIVSDYSLQVWELETNTIETIVPHDSLYDYDSTSAVFSPDGESILARISRFSYDSWLAAILDPTNGEILKRYKHITAIALAFPPDENKILTAGTEAALYEWDARTGELLHTYNDFGNITPGYFRTSFSPEAFGSVCFSPDKTKILALVRDPDYNGKIHPVLFDIHTGSVIKHHGTFDEDVVSIAFLPNGSRYLIGLTGDVLNLWDTESGKHLGTYNTGELGSHRIEKLSFSADGAKILGAIRDRGIANDTYGGIIWDVETGAILFSILSSPIPHTLPSSNISISPSSKMVAFGPGLYDLKTGDLIKQFSGENIVFSPDGTALASVSTPGTQKVQIDLWDASTLQPIRSIEYEEQTDRQTVSYGSPECYLLSGWIDPCHDHRVIRKIMECENG